MLLIFLTPAFQDTNWTLSKAEKISSAEISSMKVMTMKDLVIRPYLFISKGYN